MSDPRLMGPFVVVFEDDGGGGGGGGGEGSFSSDCL